MTTNAILVIKLFDLTFGNIDSLKGSRGFRRFKPSPVDVFIDQSKSVLLLCLYFYFCLKSSRVWLCFAMIERLVAEAEGFETFSNRKKSFESKIFNRGRKFQRFFQVDNLS